MVRTGNVDFSCKRLTSIEIRKSKYHIIRRVRFRWDPPEKDIWIRAWCILCKCIRIIQDAIHHVVEISLLQITIASCKKGSFMVCLFSNNFSLWNRHTSTDFEDIFPDHVTLCILSVLEFIAQSWNGGGGEGWVVWGGLIPNLNSVCLRFTAVSWKKGYSCYI